MRRPADLTGPYFLRYSLADGTRHFTFWQF
jgi:hypothetical protein